jgi:hypothetical protein
LSTAISNTFPKYGLTRGQIPFVKPSNFAAVLAVNGLHLVVDNIPVGGMPDHAYIDKRETGTPIPLDALVGESIRELGYRQPIGVLLPNTALSDDESTAKNIIDSIAENICVQLAEAAKIDRLNIPQGYQHLRRFVPAFLHDHPEPDNNVFLMMRFKKGEHYDEIEKTLRKKFQNYRLTVMRADDKDYTGDLWENVCLYMFGCKYGIAVFEEIDEREFNPSVALELGFMVAHDKRCLLLKDQRMPKMPTDIVGKLYKPFDTYNIEQSITGAVDSWANDIGLSK